MTKSAIWAFALLCVAGIAAAAPLPLPRGEALYFQFNNIEQVNSANTLVVPGYAPASGTQGNWGLMNISSAQVGAALPTPPHNDIGGGPAFFSDDGPGGSAGQITGIFYGIQFTSPTTATGGFLDLFWHDPGTDTIDANCLAGTACLPDGATVGRFTSGTFLARLNFAFGIIPGDELTTLSSNTDPSTAGGSGHADSFANVNLLTPGVYSDLLNGNWFFVDGADPGTIRGDGPNELRDLRFSTFFNVDLATWDGPAGTVGLRSNDPARVLTSDVPEPATFFSLGSGLLILGLLVRWRNRMA